MSKKCHTCKCSKPLEDFPKRKLSKDGRDGRCKSCVSLCHQKYKDRRKPNKMKYEQENRDYLYMKKLEYSHSHKKEKAEYDKQYRKMNKEKIRKYKENWTNKHKNSPTFKIKRNLRRRIHHCIKGQRSAHTMDLLGCDIAHFLHYLEEKFTEGMTWENYGSYWHVDHIKPCCSFDLKNLEDQKMCFHYTNMQPLLAEENLKKSYIFEGKNCRL